MLGGCIPFPGRIRSHHPPKHWEDLMKPVVSRVFAAVCLAAALLAPNVLQAQTTRAITHIAGDL